MKKLFFIGLAAATIVSCNNQPKADYALFSGKIENPTGKNLTITGDDFKHQIDLAEDGTFSDTLRIKPGYYNLREGRETTSFYLEPGYTLNISLNTKEFDESINYTGIGAENNNYLAKKFLENEKNGSDPKGLYSLDETAFKEKIQSEKEETLKLLSETEGLNKEFVTLEEKNTHYTYLTQLKMYPGYHQYVTKNNDFKVSDDFHAELTEVDFDNEAEYNTIQSYKQLANMHFNDKLRNSESPESVIDEIKNLKTAALKNDLAKSISNQLSPSNEKSQLLYDAIMTISSDDVFKSGLTEKYNTIKKLAKGNPSPTFAYENYKGGTTSLEDLKGKFVYIDVWATWCGPCKAEIPFLKEVEKEFHNKNVAFVSISIDQKKDYDAWRKMIEEKELEGIQLIADNDWKSQFVADYAINGIPRFILLDTEGNIISADAPRPSNPELKETLNSLL